MLHTHRHTHMLTFSLSLTYNIILLFSPRDRFSSVLSVLLILSSNLQLTKVSLTSYFPCWNFHCLLQSRLYSVISYKLLSPFPVIPHHSYIISSLISLKFFNLDKCLITVISEGIYCIIINVKKQLIFAFKWSLFWNIVSRTMA